MSIFLDWAKAHPDMKYFDAGVLDISGIWRGKRLPISQLTKLAHGDFKLPLSALSVNIWGEDPSDSALVYEAGDIDGIGYPIDEKIFEPLLENSVSAFVPLIMHYADGAPYLGDPRQALAWVLQKFEQKNLTPVVAFELEFYVIDEQIPPRIPTKKAGRDHFDFENVLSLDEVNSFSAIFDEIYAACERNHLDLDTLISEAGIGQFEVNFKHKTHALLAADEVCHFKRIIREIFAAHGMRVCYMAKMNPDAPGSGLHVHFSLLNEQGENLFNDGHENGSPLLLHAIGGLLTSLTDLQLIFAPHLNSYRRYSAQTHAPAHISWGYDNRMAALRIPASSPENRRIEHRLSGADANPYLVLAAIFAGALYGMDNQIDPMPPVQNVQELDEALALNPYWEVAVANFAKSELAKAILPEELCHRLIDMKMSEIEGFKTEISRFEYKTYLAL